MRDHMTSYCCNKKIQARLGLTTSPTPTPCISFVTSVMPATVPWMLSSPLDLILKEDVAWLSTLSQKSWLWFRAHYSVSLCLRIFLFFFFNAYLFLRDRERPSASRGGAEREGDTESKAGSRLWAVSTEPNLGLNLMNREIMSWAEVRCLINWATPVLHILLILNLILCSVLSIFCIWSKSWGLVYFFFFHVFIRFQLVNIQYNISFRCRI